ncbi:hypothetical protein CBR_g25812 [Chara braunii]|uniref:DUF659 domain-containing protein n=1 Tax=Chara braunii TaxID=69332 RepID=A0A388L6E8_CHABU|nr:hypothetical protein CBR_g25812 [Chara braunii]|eukprot:GBG77880.1 hypothetical protein CBR_g25812 [Chara braunii]
MASSSQPSSAAAKGKGKVNAMRTPPEFVPQPDSRQRTLQRERTVLRWIEQGQAAEPKGFGQYWVRCRLCKTVFTASATRAVEHFLKKGKPCIARTGEVLHFLALDGVKIDGEAAKRMLHAYRVEKGIAEDTGMTPRGVVEKAVLDEMEALIRPSCEASTTVAKSGKKTQTSIRKWAENTSQKRLDLQWGRALCRSGVPFNFVRQDETKALLDLYMELGAQKAKTRMTSFKTMRTTVLDALYDEVKLTAQPIMDKMDISGCTLITDGCTDRKFRPVMNFIAAGDGGAVLVKVVDMSGRKKNATALAKLWEEVIREIGVHKVNAICTDNAGVNKRAAKILRRRKDLDIAKIPWLLCAAHTLSLLLKDISNLEWVLPIRKQAKTMVKFIKNHHRTVSLYSKSSMDDKKTLILPTEVRFASVYQMLLRLSDRQWVLEDMMKTGWLDIHWSAKESRKKVDDIFQRVRSEEWWRGVHKVVNVMRPVHEVWGTFFDDPEDPNPQDPAVLPGPLDDTVEEAARLARLRKAPRGRILEGDEYDDTSSSEDDEDLIWNGKGGTTQPRSQPARLAKGKAQIDVDYEEEEEEESEEDEDPNFELRPPGDGSESDQDWDDSPSLINPCFMRKAQQGCTEESTQDIVERAAARALAERDHEIVQQRVEQDNARRVAVPPLSRASRAQDVQLATRPTAADSTTRPEAGGATEGALAVTACQQQQERRHQDEQQQDTQQQAEHQLDQCRTESQQQEHAQQQQQQKREDMQCKEDARQQLEDVQQ